LHQALYFCVLSQIEQPALLFIWTLRAFSLFKRQWSCEKVRVQRIVERSPSIQSNGICDYFCFMNRERYLNSHSRELIKDHCVLLGRLCRTK
jgi:hypothetical protein